MGFYANVLKMDKFGNVKPFTFILSTKNYNHLGQLNNVKYETVDFKANLNGANELSFEVYKKIENEVEKIWSDITDLKSIYIPELDEYFEIQVVYNDKLEETKTVVCKSLCEAELSQTYIYGTEINTELDIDRPDYAQTVLYDEINPKASLLHRVLSFVPQYKIKHVDDSLCKLQRSFSIDGTTVYDFLTGECAEQFNCLFVFDSTDRSISAYDLYSSCNECGHRDAYSFVCPKCGNTNINYFGNDTDIYIDKENFSDDIKLEVDVDSIKNCLRLRSGDDIMDEAIISMNPNGTRYIYYISDEQREDMSDELVNKIDEYDELVEQYTPEYQDLALDIRELQDRKTYYESTMMPSPIEDDEEIPSNSISNKEIAKLTQEKLSPVGMDELTTATTLDTVDIVVKNYAKVFVNSSLVKIDIVEGSTFTYKGKDKDDWDYGIWTGKIKLTAYSDANDVAITDTLTLTIHDNYGEFLQQKVMKEMALNDKEGSVFNVLDIEDFDEFKLALKEYCLSRLRSFHMALDTACITLVSLDQATENADWYEDIYVPYHNKLLACSDEILVRESQIKEIQDQLDILYARKSEIQSILNFENFLGEDLYIEFCTYRRESEYHNDNYISDGLSNAEIIDRAKEFIEVAKKELIRSATKKYTISTNLHNLLLMEEFKPLANKFALGNFIRVRVGKDLFRLRLNSYHLTFSDLSTIDVEFSDTTKSINVIDATQKILADAQSMASNISYISKQAEKGEKANESVNNIVQNGLDSALTQIKNNVNQEFVIDNNGILGRRYNDITGKYSPEQIRITNNIIALTENNWVDTTCALGKHKYTYYDVDSKTFKQSIGFGLSSKFSQNSFNYGSQIIGGDIFSENYSPTTGTHIALNDGSFNFGHKIIYDAETNKATMRDVTIEWDSTNPPKKSDIEGLEYYLEQLDGRIQTYSQPTDPSINWKTSEDKAKHDGDIWFDTTNGLTKRWNNTTGKWDIVTDSELKSLAQSKAQIFTSQPIPPYSIGDLWVEGKDGDIWHCMVNKKKGELFEKNDWLISSKYTDDSAFNDFIEKEYADNLKEVYSQIDKKSETWYQSSDPSIEWETNELKSLHVGDIWYDTDAEFGENQTFVYVFKNNKYSWEVINGVPADIFDMADGKCSLYVSKPSNYKKNDIWILEVENKNGSNTEYPAYRKGTLLVSLKDNSGYAKSDWIESVKYTDDSALQSFITGEYADDLNNISKQIDKRAQTWYLTKVEMDKEVATWTDKSIHVGDLWYRTDAINGQDQTFVYNSSYEWEVMNGVPKEIFDMADGKCSLYTSKPSNYKAKDIWILDVENTNGANGTYPKYEKGTLLVSLKDNSSYSVSDWSEIVKYSNKLQDFINNTYASALANIQGQIDAKADSYYQSTAPHLEYTKVANNETYNNYVGDLWFNTSDNKSYTYVKVSNSSDSTKYDYKWVETNGVPDDVYDLIDGKATIYVSKPSAYNIGDLLIPTNTFTVSSVNFIKGKVYKAIITATTFTASDWVEISYTDDTSLNAFIESDYAHALDNINKQIDGKADTYYQSAKPHSEYTNVVNNDTYNLYVGDLWYDTVNNKSYMYTKTEANIKDYYNYTWKEIDGVPDEVYDKIDGKATIYTSKPSSQRDGDLLIPNSTFTVTYNSVTYTFMTKKIFRCASTQTSFRPDLWMEVAYTDDTALNTFIAGDYATALSNISTQIDGKARAWYQSEDPSLTWDKNENHEGDLWYDTDANSQVTSIYHNNAWKATSVPKSLFDTIDGIASIYVTMPSKPQVGDLLIPTANIGTTYKTGKVYKYNGTSWVEIAYTDDTKANEALDAANNAQITANSAMGVAENAETIGNNLVNVLGYDGTKIANTHIYSPVISGGSILVGNKTGTYAEITTEGILNCKGANISGDIIANSLTLGSGVTIPSTSIDGLDSTIKGYGYQTKAETEKIVKSYGYQTKANVTSLVTSYGYKNADEVKGIVEGYGYTTNSAAYKYLLNGSYFLVSGTKISEITGYTDFKNSLVLKNSISSTTSTETITLPSGEKVNRTTYTTTIPNSNGTSKTFKTYEDGAYVFTNIGIGNGSSDPANSSSTDTYVMIDKNGCLTADNAVIRGNIYAINGYFNGTIHATDGEFTGKITSLTGSIGGIDITSDRLRSRNFTTQGVASTQYEASIRKYNPEATNPTKEPAFLIRKRNYDGTSYDSSWEHIFKVTYEGKLTSLDATITGGNIGGFTIDGNSIHSGTWGTEGSVMMCTGTGGSKEIGGSDEISGWCFTAGSKFGVTKNGDVYASNVDITGKINATSGTIDSVTATNLTVVSGEIKLGDATLNQDGLVVFGTTGKSKLGCVNIDSNSLFIGSWDYSSDVISERSTPDVFICKGSKYKYPLAGQTQSGWAIGAGKNFGVTIDGSMYCKKGEIGGLTIHTNGSLGKTYADEGGLKGIMIYPDGFRANDGRLYYIVIYQGSQEPVGGISSDGWHSI